MVPRLLIPASVFTPGQLPERQVIAAGVAAMGGIFIVDLAAPPDVRLHVLYIFPLAAIAFHCQRRWTGIAALVLSVMFQGVALVADRYSPLAFAADIFVAVSASGLSILLAARARRYYLDLLVQATTDPLTGLLNRRAFQRALDFEISRQRRYGGVFAVLVLDLDGFKVLNDSHGHHVGDQALRIVAAQMRRNVRESDVAARLGGDEFGVLMANTDRDGCSHASTHLGAAIEHAMASAGLGTTASLGFEVFDESPATASEAMQRADKAMYAAKRAGKSRVPGPSGVGA